MASEMLGKAIARAKQLAEPALVKARATEFAKKLKSEYEAGKRGDPEPDPDTDPETGANPGTADKSDEADAEQVAEAMRGVDWAKVRAATSERGADAAAAMRTMAKEVDWAKVQPVAAKVSTALMAAVASGQLGIGGRLGSTVARAIINDRNLAQRVSTELVRQEQPLPPDFRNVIDATATE
ncbi:MAG: hypothetical protein K8R99_00465 [Actinomycetia bacterium]|nr:hypothetical protein [Actinomycetes bacterium]